MHLTASELADKLNLTRGRISQLVGAGRLEGCYRGDGRARRFDLARCIAALDRTLDRGQMMGNGAKTRRALEELPFGATGDGPSVQTVPPSDAPPAADKAQRESGVLSARDPDRYEMARTQKAEEEARKLRRQNAEAEGTFVLASEVTRSVARLIGQEIAEMETVLRDGARRVADETGADFKTVRKLLIDVWREHRGSRSAALADAADQASMTDDERAGDI